MVQNKDEFLKTLFCGLSFKDEAISLFEKLKSSQISELDEKVIDYFRKRLNEKNAIQIDYKRLLEDLAIYVGKTRSKKVASFIVDVLSGK